MPRGVWDLPGPGTESVCAALAGGFLTTGRTGKSPDFFTTPVLADRCHGDAQSSQSPSPRRPRGWGCTAVSRVPRLGGEAPLTLSARQGRTGGLS